MALTVFISHSIADTALVYELDNLLRLSGIQTYVAEWHVQPGGYLPDKVAEAIDQCDCVLALMTVDGARSEFVQQEIGYAKKAGKQIIPVVEQGVTTGGFLWGIEYVPFRRYDPSDAITRVTEYLTTLSVRKEEEDRNKAILAGLIIFFGLMALAASQRAREGQL